MNSDFLNQMQQFSDDYYRSIDYNGGDIFSDWFNPASKEYRQNAQQLMMEQLTPAAKVAGLKAAGINPLLAGDAIAGASAYSSQPQTSVNPLGDFAGAAASLAGGVNSLSAANAIGSKLPFEIASIKANTSKMFADLGFTEAQTQGVLLDNSYKDEDWQSRLANNWQNFENMQQSYKVLEAQHLQILQDIENQRMLAKSQEELNIATRLKIEEDTRWNKAVNDWCIENKLYLRDSGIDGITFNMIQNGDSAQYGKFVSLYSHYRGSVASAEANAKFSAEASFAQQIAKARQDGVNASDLAYNRFGNGWNFLGQTLKNFGFSGNDQGLSSWISDKAESLSKKVGTDVPSGRAIRKEITSAIDMIEKHLEEYPADDKPEVREKLEQLNDAMKLSNRELREWWSKNN